MSHTLLKGVAHHPSKVSHAILKRCRTRSFKVSHIILNRCRGYRHQSHPSRLGKCIHTLDQSDTNTEINPCATAICKLLLLRSISLSTKCGSTFYCRRFSTLIPSSWCSKSGCAPKGRVNSRLLDKLRCSLALPRVACTRTE